MHASGELLCLNVVLDQNVDESHFHFETIFEKQVLFQYLLLQLDDYLVGGVKGMHHEGKHLEYLIEVLLQHDLGHLDLHVD